MLVVENGNLIVNTDNPDLANNSDSSNIPEVKELDDEIEIGGNRGDEGVLIGALIKDDDENEDVLSEDEDNDVNKNFLKI